MKKQKCPKCSSKCIQDAELVIFACNTENGTYFNQSDRQHYETRTSEVRR